MSDNVIELRDVAVELDGRRVLEVPDLAVRRGEILTLLGENGSGKTTLLRLLGLLIRPVAGKVFFGGEEVDFTNPGRLLELRRRMSAVMQEPLLCKMSVRRNVALGLRFRGLSRQEADQRVDPWLERLAISHLTNRQATKLSGGEAQRTSLARAMVIDPEALLLDEPFAALDAPTRQDQLEQFHAVLSESNVTAVFATHDRGEALLLGDRLAVLTRGRIAQLDIAETVFSRPKSPEVARFLGVETLLKGSIFSSAQGRLEIQCGDIRVDAVGDGEVGDRVHVAVRPEEIEIIDSTQGPSAAHCNTIEGNVARVSPKETHFRVEIDCGQRVVAMVGRARFRQLGVAVGASVVATFTVEATHVIKAQSAS